MNMWQCYIMYQRNQPSTNIQTIVSRSPSTQKTSDYYTLVDICWHLLTHIDTCWHTLTHVDTEPLQPMRWRSIWRVHTSCSGSNTSLPSCSTQHRVDVMSLRPTPANTPSNVTNRYTYIYSGSFFKAIHARNDCRLSEIKLLAKITSPSEYKYSTYILCLLENMMYITKGWWWHCQISLWLQQDAVYISQMMECEQLLTNPLPKFAFYWKRTLCQCRGPCKPCDWHFFFHTQVQEHFTQWQYGRISWT